MIFPTVKGTNLLRQALTLPEDFQGEINLVFVPFYQWHQEEVDSWGQLAKELELAYPVLRYYELPTLQQMNFFSKTVINEGMRAGIPDPQVRARTITLYVNKAYFRRSLQMPDEGHIYVLLVDRQGAVLWSSRGAYTPQQAAALLAKVQEINLVRTPTVNASI
jgi:hypothetical protein